VVWFEMLTGKLPFVGDTPAAMAVARLHCAPLRPSQLNPDVPKWVDDIVLGCLERDRSRRFSSAQQVLDAIVCGPSPTGTAPKRRFSGRFWAALSAACVVAASLGWHAVGLKQVVSYRRFATAKRSDDPSGAGAQLPPPNTTASVGDVQVYPVPAIPRLQTSVAIVGARAPTLSTRKGAPSPKQPMLLLEPHEPTTPAPTDRAVSRPVRNSPDWLEP
jgi:serine/threonine protein kinase